MAAENATVICDRCGTRSPEYTPWWSCVECMEDVCDECVLPGSGDDETGRAVCRRCAAAEIGEAVGGDYIP